MKTLKQTVFEVLVHKHADKNTKAIGGNKSITEDEFKQILKENDYMITVGRYKYKMNMYREYECDYDEEYIFATGDSHIGKKYGQDTYDEESLSGQDLDGGWYESNKNNPCNLVLNELAKRYDIKCSGDKNPYHEYGYMVHFEKCEYIRTSKNLKYYDCR